MYELKYEKKGCDLYEQVEKMTKRSAHFLSIIEVLLLEIKKRQVNKKRK